MLTLEPLTFEKHFNDFVNRFELERELNLVIKELQTDTTKALLEKFKISLLQEGILQCIEPFCDLLNENDDGLNQALGLDYDYHHLAVALRTTIDLLFCLKSIKRDHTQSDNFCIMSHEHLKANRAKSLGVINICTPYSFGVDEDFHITSPKYS